MSTHSGMFRAARAHIVLTVLIAVTATTLLPALLWGASDKQDDLDRLAAATTVFHEIMGTPDKAIPQEILDGAHCIAIVPGEKKFALGIGGNYGKGIAICRASATAAWGQPLFITIGGGSWGLQIGGQSTDVVMVFGDRHQLDSLLSSKFRIGADAAAAAGPVGRHVSADTDVKLNAEILTYGRSKGAFAGISLTGAVVQPDDTGNAAMYGPNATQQTILSGKGTTPAAAQALIRELNRNIPVH